MASLIHEQIVTEFKGKFPNIPLPDDIDIKLFGEDPWFSVMKIGKVGAISRNGRVYTREAVQQLVDQVNERRPEGRWGHIKEENRATEYGPPAVRWLAAMLDEEGVAWGKVYAVTPDAREHLRVAAISKARIGTSILAKARMDGNRVMEIDLETIDLADARRVGIPDTADFVHITHEQEDEKRMTEEHLKERIQELTDDRKVLLEDKKILVTERDLLKTRVAELEGEAAKTKPVAASYQAITELLGDKPLDAIKALKDHEAALVAENADLLKEALVAKVATIKFEKARPIVQELLEAAHPTSRKDLDAKFDEITARPSLKELVAEQVSRQMGPRQAAGNTQHGKGKEDGWKDFVDIPEDEDENKKGGEA